MEHTSIQPSQSMPTLFLVLLVGTSIAGCRNRHVPVWPVRRWRISLGARLNELEWGRVKNCPKSAGCPRLLTVAGYAGYSI